ncbi:HAD-superfamily phosphatase [Coemansia reversa NRRL 1564]|uniref:HAD-superfamily phosphatase n=1 Tax=Coemansia reversa (strain ATCC 12441 / NRRL 1564) TaxID=763665 RepID=A0A2G5BG94_COERN|nr:HAD-superfamily phosphatase [Coemansia reversa NRRL 1564]|eukprot:PIA18035.1 HAD-superfamily phosphatase [Coemansia reversa NRRL 1564]
MVQSFNIAALRSGWKLLRKPSLLMPQMVVSDIRAIPFAKLHQIGIKYLVFDKDNCLTAPYIDQIHPEFKHVWSQCLSIFSPCNILIVSNSVGTRDDPKGHGAERVERGLGVPVLRHVEKKPRCGAEILDALGADSPADIAVVGDRLFTDVALANLSGMVSIWTQVIVSEKGDNRAAALIRTLEHRLYNLTIHMHDVYALLCKLSTSLGF